MLLLTTQLVPALSLASLPATDFNKHVVTAQDFRMLAQATTSGQGGKRALLQGTAFSENFYLMLSPILEGNSGAIVAPAALVCCRLLYIHTDLTSALCWMQKTPHPPLHRLAKLVTPPQLLMLSRCLLHTGTLCRQHMPQLLPYSRGAPIRATTSPPQPTFPPYLTPLQSRAPRQLLRPSMQPSLWAGKLQFTRTHY